MNILKIDNNIESNDLYDLIISKSEDVRHITMSKKNFRKIMIKDVNLDLIDMRKYGFGYSWFNVYNLFSISTDTDLKDNEIIFYNKNDLHNIIRSKILKKIKNNINDIN